MIPKWYFKHLEEKQNKRGGKGNAKLDGQAQKRLDEEGAKA